MMYGQVIGGLIVLLLGGDILVRGAVSLSRRIGVSPLVVGLTVVAMGTSMPELVVVLDAAIMDAALDQAAEISIGNVVGSNIANVLLVLGLPALIRPVACDAKGLRIDTAIMVAASVMFAAVCLGDVIEWWQGIVMVAALAAYIAWHYRAAMGGRGPSDIYAEEVKEYENAHRPLWRSVFYVLGGIAGLIVGADMLVDGAVALARTADVSRGGHRSVRGCARHLVARVGDCADGDRPPPRLACHRQRLGQQPLQYPGHHRDRGDRGSVAGTPGNPRFRSLDS